MNRTVASKTDKTDKTARADGFSSLVGAKPAAGAATSAPVGLVGGVFAVDDEADAGGARSRGLSAGHDLLDELESIRRAILLGTIQGAALTRLSEKLAKLETSGDPKLDTIIADIELRVAVEIAKLSPAHIEACRHAGRTV